MVTEKAEVLVIGPPKKLILDGLSEAFVVHHITDPSEFDQALAAKLAPQVKGIAVSGPPGVVDAAMMQALKRLELVSSFGVGYDHVDAKHAGARGITVTNTPDVLNEEVADTAIGLLIATAREFRLAERYLRDGKWIEGDYRLTPSLRDRTIGMVGMGRIGKVIARRLDSMRLPVGYHTRRPQPDVPYRHYPSLIEMARDVDVLLLILPGGVETQGMINGKVLEALGPNGILINMARGSVVDEEALIEALRQGKILSAGLDVFVKEPQVPKELIALDNVVLLPHVGSASLHTRQAMEQLVVDNLLVWNEGKPPLTPVPETPWPPKKAS